MGQAPRWVIVALSLLVMLAGGALISDSLITEAKRDAEVSEETQREAKITRDFLGLMSGTTRQETLQKQQASATRREQVADVSPASPEAQRELATAYFDVGDTLFYTIIAAKDHEGALSNFKKALEIRQSLAALADPPSESARDLARTHDAIGDVYYDQYKLKDALSSYQQAAKVSPRQWRMQRVARIHYELGDNDAAIGYHKAIAKGWQEKVDKDPDDTDSLRELSLAHGNVAEILVSKGRDDEAGKHYRASLATANNADYRVNNWKRALALHQLGLGRLYLKKGKRSDARVAFQACASLFADFGFSTNDSFDAACCSALAGDADAAFQSLQAAFEGNWHNTMSIENNPDLAGLRDDPRWRSLLVRMYTKRSK